MPHSPTRNFGEEKISHSCWELNPNSSSSWPSCHTNCSKPTHTSASSDCWHYKFPISCPFSAAYITPAQGPVYHFTTRCVSYRERKGSWTPFTNPNAKEHFVSHPWPLIQNIHQKPIPVSTNQCLPTFLFARHVYTSLHAFSASSSASVVTTQYDITWHLTSGQQFFWERIQN